MDKVAQLAQLLGHATRNAVINTVDYGLMNCPISATGIRNKYAAKGVSITMLLGKTTKKKSMSPGYVLVPRVTQVKQNRIVDIIFIKKATFLLGIFTPLGLGIVYFLHNRFEAQLGTAL